MPFLLFATEEDIKVALNELFGEIADFHLQNIEKIIRCFESFQNESVHTRQTLETAMSYITDPQKLKEFQEQHEDKNRSSLNAWVKNAWSIAKKMRKDETNTKEVTNT
jgi:hypothetical protein